MSAPSVLAGRRVLVVEDDGMLTMLLEDFLTAMGCKVVGSVARYAEAVRRCAQTDFDIVLLDINLRGERTFAIAESLRARGVAFLLTTGYDVGILPQFLRGTRLLQKPYRRQDLERALRAALEAARSGP